MGRVIYFEIPARDIDRAKRFYSVVFGWPIVNGSKPSVLVYTAKTDYLRKREEGGAINVGIVERSKYVPNPVIAIEVDDIGESVRQIENAGGKILENGGAGNRMVYCRDTEGNVLGIVEKD